MKRSRDAIELEICATAESINICSQALAASSAEDLNGLTTQLVRLADALLLLSTELAAVD